MTLKLRSLLIAVALALVALGCALAVLPARWMMAMLPAQWPLAIVDASGTLWSGSATLAIGPEGRRRTLPAPVQWRAALLPAPSLQVTHPWLAGPLSLRPNGLGVQVSAQSLQLPASALSLMHDGIRILNPAGELLLNWPATTLGFSGPPTGATLLTLQWRNAASSLSPIRPLGDYQILIKQAANQQIDLTLSTRKGPLQLEGAGTLGRGLQFDGAAYADPNASTDTHAALRELLVALGPVQNGRTQLRFR